jgi:hypothetical protein
MPMSSKKATISRKEIDRSGKVPRRRGETPVIIAPGDPDQEALRSVIREWLVPLLVRQFLAVHGVEAPPGQNRSELSKTAYRTHLQGARGAGRVNETA